jgi:hypothetical protein
MGYLALSDFPSFSKAVISFWFRVPRVSLSTAISRTKFLDGVLFDGIVPLVVMGQKGTLQTPTSIMFPDLPNPWSITTQVPPALPADPTFIGVNVAYANATPDTAALMANFQTCQKPVVSNLLWENQGPLIYVDNTYMVDATGAVYSDTIPVTPDVWHHLLVSVELRTMTARGSAVAPDFTTGGIAQFIDGAAKLYVALDDRNYQGFDLSNGWNFNGHPGTPNNEVVTDDAGRYAGKTPDYDFYNNVLGGLASYSIIDPSVPVGAIGFPGTAEFVDNIYRVEMAEFQIFTGVTLDTGIEANRRLFITAPDKSGRQGPVNTTPIMIPISKTAVGDPTTWEPGADASALVSPLLDPSSAPTTVKALARPASPGGVADVDFTKCSLNWIMGRNLGSAPGKVAKTGKIKAYFPDPNLGGPQGS